MLRSYYQTSFVKQYEKSYRLLRTKTCINNAYRPDIGRRLEDLPALVERMAGTNQGIFGRCLNYSGCSGSAKLPTGSSKCRQSVVDSHSGSRSSTMKGPSSLSSRMGGSYLP